MFEAVLSFYQAMKDCSQTVEPEVTVEVPEKVQNEDLLRQPKKRNKM